MSIWSFNRDGNAVLGDALAAAYPQGPMPVQRRDREGAQLNAWADSATSKRAGPAADPAGSPSKMARHTGPCQLGICAKYGESPFGGFYK